MSDSDLTGTFRLTSESCELLLAFEESASLNDLAKRIHRDPSVVSKQLKRLADTEPVLEKIEGRWRLTELGRRINRWTKTSLRAQRQIFLQHEQFGLDRNACALPDGPTALLVIGAQVGFQDPSWGPRNNIDAEQNIAALIKQWHANDKPVVYAQTVSRKPGSPLTAGTKGSVFLDFVRTDDALAVIENQGSRSSFADPKLHETLGQAGIKNLVLVGFSVNHCIDATARAASDLGYRVYVVSDATIAFDRVGLAGENISADMIHRIVMANLSQDFAVILDTSDLLRERPTVESA